MKKSEKNEILKWAATKSDAQLEKEYYDGVYDSLGTLVDGMIELGYDLVDIQERREYEKFLREKSDLIGWVCEQRGIELWKEKMRNKCNDCIYYHEENNICQSKKCATAHEGYVTFVDRLFCKLYKK